MTPRFIIDRVYDSFRRYDFKDTSNYAVKVAREFIDFLKSGEVLSINKNFLSNDKFHRVNSISSNELFQLMFATFEELKNEILTDRKLCALVDETMLIHNKKVESLRKRLIKRHINLLELEEQATIYGAGQAPLPLKNQITNEREAIEEIELMLEQVLVE